MVTPYKQALISKMFCDAFIAGQLDCRVGIRLQNQKKAYYSGHEIERIQREVREKMT